MMFMVFSGIPDAATDAKMAAEASAGLLLDLRCSFEHSHPNEPGLGAWSSHNVAIPLDTVTRTALPFSTGKPVVATACRKR